MYRKLHNYQLWCSIDNSCFDRSKFNHLFVEMSKLQEIQLISDSLIHATLNQAKSSQRMRMNYNFHSTMEENPHRFLNVMLKGTYIQPHRHFEDPKSESFIIMQGRAAFLVFDDEGKCTLCSILDSSGKGDAYGIDIAPGVWHTLHVLSESVVCFEVKPGPYTQASDKEFASWAPKEAELTVKKYQQSLQKIIDKKLSTLF